MVSNRVKFMNKREYTSLTYNENKKETHKENDENVKK